MSLYTTLGTYKMKVFTKYGVPGMFTLAIKSFLRKSNMAAVYSSFHGNGEEKFQNGTKNEIKGHIYDV